jgi:hypothetical protein
VADRLTRNERARRYLQSSQTASKRNLPAATRRAARDVMRGHEAKYPGVRMHALAGGRKHFDKPLSAPEREHQGRLRKRERMSQSDVIAARQELDEARQSRRAEQRSQQLAGPRAARKAAGGAGEAISDVIGGGNVFMYFIGVALLLTLVYLLVAGKGVNAITGLVGVVTGGVRAFVAPVDPIRAAESALGAGPISAAAVSSPGASAPTAAPSAPGSAPGRSFGASSSQLRRKDQGRDVQLAPGAAIRAPGAGEVVDVKSDPAGFGPDYPIERFTSGPYKGQELYLGHVDSALKRGAKFKAGAILARTSRTGHNAPPGWAEIGFASGGTPGPFGQTAPF